MKELFISASMEIGTIVDSDIGALLYSTQMPVAAASGPSTISGVPRFVARRSYRPRAMAAGLLWLAVIGGGTVVLAATTQGDLPYGWLAGAGVLGYLIATFAAMIPQDVTLDVSRDEVIPSWRPPARVHEVRLGLWVVAGIDAAMGVVAHVGKLKIGGEQHGGDGYSLDGPAVRSVDCQLPAADFDALVAALGVARGTAGPLVIPLVASTQSAGGVFRMMLPWLATMAVAGAFGLIVGTVGESLTATPAGTIVIGGVTAAIVVGGLALTIVRSIRVRRPDRELRVLEHDLVLAKVGGDELVRVGWASVGVEAWNHRFGTGAGRFELPVLELALDGVRLRIGAWDQRLAWPEGTRRGRGPRWLVGAPQWPRLVEKLKKHGRM
jgi:hypothetical protein